MRGFTPSPSESLARTGSTPRQTRRPSHASDPRSAVKSFGRLGIGAAHGPVQGPRHGGGGRLRAHQYPNNHRPFRYRCLCPERAPGDLPLPHALHGPGYRCCDSQHSRRIRGPAPGRRREAHPDNRRACASHIVPRHRHGRRRPRPARGLARPPGGGPHGRRRDHGHGLPARVRRRPAPERGPAHHRGHGPLGHAGHQHRRRLPGPDLHAAGRRRRPPRRRQRRAGHVLPGQHPGLAHLHRRRLAGHPAPAGRRDATCPGCGPCAG